MRPDLESFPKDFRHYYYLKEELSAFCRRHGLPRGGCKAELTGRIALFIESGAKGAPPARRISVCSQERRIWFENRLGKNFHFFQAFIHWLRENPEKSLEEAAEAYLILRAEGKHQKNPIMGSCRYNAYVRAFFADNKNLTLKDAITCWNYKKSLAGNQEYQASDLLALK